MPASVPSIDASVLVFNEDMSGASIVVALERPIASRFDHLEVEGEDVFLVTEAGKRHQLREVRPVDAEMAAAMNVVVVKEMLLNDVGGFDELREYPIDVLDLTTDPSADQDEEMSLGMAL